MFFSKFNLWLSGQQRPNPSQTWKLRRCSGQDAVAAIAWTSCSNSKAAGVAITAAAHILLLAPLEKYRIRFVSKHWNIVLQEYLQKLAHSDLQLLDPQTVIDQAQKVAEPQLVWRMWRCADKSAPNGV